MYSHVAAVNPNLGRSARRSQGRRVPSRSAALETPAGRHGQLMCQMSVVIYGYSFLIPIVFPCFRGGKLGLVPFKSTLRITKRGFEGEVGDSRGWSTYTKVPS